MRTVVNYHIEGAVANANRLQKLRISLASDFYDPSHLGLGKHDALGVDIDSGVIVGGSSKLVRRA